MAMMAVKIENEASVLMNEFFDFQGWCYALSASRTSHAQECAALEDFYECTVQTDWLDDVPVIFVLEKQIIGWYVKARIYRKRQMISAFLEGNIKARALDAVLLPKSERIDRVQLDFGERMYEIIEEDDIRYEQLLHMISENTKGIPLRYELVDSFYSSDRLRLLQLKAGSDQSEAKKMMKEHCLERCTYYASRVMNDECRDIRELKSMLQYARQAVIYDRDSADAWYYQAMACEQLGFVKDGLKAIERALALEPDADDLLAQKGHLLAAKGDYKAAVDCYEEAWSIVPEDGYLLHIGQTWFAMGNVDAAYKAFGRVKDKSLLEVRGINLKDMEKRWPFVNVRGFSLKELFGRKH